jgi:hypothetical protein
LLRVDPSTWSRGRGKRKDRFIFPPYPWTAWRYYNFRKPDNLSVQGQGPACKGRFLETKKKGREKRTKKLRNCGKLFSPEKRNHKNGAKPFIPHLN